MLPIEGSRGCPYQCTYCCTYISWGRRLRYKQVDQLIAEMEETQARHEPSTMHFVDDNLSFKREWFIELLNKLMHRENKLRFTASNFSIKHLDEEIIDLLKQADIYNFAVAVETGSKEMQKRIRKNLDFDKARKTVELIKSKGLRLHICWMIGFPNETKAQIKETFDFARELRAHSNQFLTVLPYPGTKLFEEAKLDELLLFDDSELDRFDNRQCDYLRSLDWTYDELRQMIYDHNIELNFLNNPCLDDSSLHSEMLAFVQSVLAGLPDHIVARLIEAYLLDEQGKRAEALRSFRAADESMKTESVSKVFSRYLEWDHAVTRKYAAYKGAEANVPA